MTLNHGLNSSYIQPFTLNETGQTAPGRDNSIEAVETSDKTKEGNSLTSLTTGSTGSGQRKCKKGKRPQLSALVFGAKPHRAGRQQ